jgi:RimK family alpha-L-glutamate ligase
MKTAWLIYTVTDANRNHDYIKWMMEEANNLNINLQLMLKERFSYGVKNNQLFIDYDGLEKKLPDFIIMRSIDSLLSTHLESMGGHVYNSALTADLANDKAKTHQYLACHHIPMVDTLFGDRSIFERKLNWDFPFVIKESSGRGGEQVYLVQSLQDIERLKPKLADKKIIVQKIATPGKDVRVFVIGNTIIAAILRESNHDLRANHSLGGTSRVYTLSDEEEKLVNNIISLFDFGLVGIDFIFDCNGHFLFNEIEDVVGSRTLSVNTDINIVKLYLEYILQDLQSNRL